MIGVLTPPQALAYLQELSPALSAALMLDGSGMALASLGAPAALQQLRAAASGGERDAPPGSAVAPTAVSSPGAPHPLDALIICVRDDDRKLIVAVPDGALAEVTRSDAGAALAAVRPRC